MAFRETFNRYGFGAVFYVIAEFVGLRIGGVDFLGWDDLREMIRTEGHEAGSHSLTHRVANLGLPQKGLRLLDLIRNEGMRKSARHLSYNLRQHSMLDGVVHRSASEEIELSKERIARELWNCDSYSYPGGACTFAMQNQVRAAGYSSARTGYSGYNSWLQLNRFALRAKTWDNVTTSQEANAWVDSAIENQSWLIEVFHTFGETKYLYSCSRRNLEEHLTYLKQRNKEIEVLRMSETS